MADFQSLGVDSWIVTAATALGITKPTDIQKLCIPHVLAGQHVTACSSTGSGKTAAFAIPILQVLAKNPFGVFALVITPTRELAFQIAEHFKALGTSIGVKEAVFVGGMDYMKQSHLLASRPHIVVGTPDRLLHFMRGSHYATVFSRLRFLVLDEADRLLDSSIFQDRLLELVGTIPSLRQTLLFSATMTAPLMNASSKLMEALSVPADQLSVVNTNVDDSSVYAMAKGLVEKYAFMPAHVKLCYLAHLLDPDVTSQAHRSVVVFLSSCKQCEIVRHSLQQLGLPVCSINGLLNQRQRLHTLNEFKRGAFRIMIATDVASRGLDIPAVDLVINFELPSNAKDYIHRVGRTARAGRDGLAITMVTPPDVRKFQRIEQVIGHRMVKHEIDEEAAIEMLDDVSLAFTKAAGIVSVELGDTILQREADRAQQKSERASGGQCGKDFSSRSNSSSEPTIEPSSSKLSSPPSRKLKIKKRPPPSEADTPVQEPRPRKTPEVVSKKKKQKRIA